jgi:hypothetical protein
MSKSSGGMSMLKGLKTRIPRNAGDPSRVPKGGKIGANPTRDSVAKTPKTLGPRVA